mmetsp:Transcript_20875/g.58132  ORF Transcript_20875/g.58132 Transcript_20875/m.58132 type:complete len:285 (+) Transcript_20875:1125-1979(+)
MSLSCIWSCSMRMLSSRSSFSRWNSLYMSSTSALTSWYFFHSFFSFLVFCSASSCRFMYLSSAASCASSISAMRRIFSSSCCRLLSSSSSRFFSSASFLRVTSARPPRASPFKILPSIAFNFLAKASFSNRIFSASSCFRTASSWILACLRFIFSASDACFWRSSSMRMASSLALIAASSLSFAICSSLMPTMPCFCASSARICVSISARIFSRVWGSMDLWTVGFPSGVVPNAPAAAAASKEPPSPSSNCFKRLISSWNSRSIASFGSSLMRGLFLIFLARLA